MDGVQAALDRPGLVAAFTAWTVQPVAIAVTVLIAASYLLGVRRLGRPWPRGRSAALAGGLVLYVWMSCGFPQVYGRALYWVWTSKTLALWLLVPIAILSGHPVQLARAVGGESGRVDRVLRSRPARVVANPLVGPALVPVLSFVLFFGPVPDWTLTSHPFGWLLDLVLVVVGALMVLPLVGLEEDVSSLAVGFSLAIGSFELVLDALPGIVLRLHTGLVTSWFQHRAHYGWTPDALHDQRIAGAVLWCVAELIDLPFLVLVYRRWLRADARDAAQVDAVLDAERAARQALPGASADAPPLEADRDAPWWLSDPAMQQRLRRRG